FGTRRGTLMLLMGLSSDASRSRQAHSAMSPPCSPKAARAPRRDRPDQRSYRERLAVALRGLRNRVNLESLGRLAGRPLADFRPGPGILPDVAPFSPEER